MLYPDHPWVAAHLAKSPKSPDDYSDIVNSVKQLERSLLKISRLEDWYSISADSLRAARLSKIISHRFRGSLAEMLRVVHPEHPWEAWRFQRMPNHGWSVKATRVGLLQSYARSHGILQPSHWYYVNFKSDRGLRRALEAFQGNQALLLNSTFDNHSWIPWKFSHASLRIWNDPEIIRRLLISIVQDRRMPKNEAPIDLSVLYSLKMSDLVEIVGEKAAARICAVSGLEDTIVQAFPGHHWERFRFHSTSKGH